MIPFSNISHCPIIFLLTFSSVLIARYFPGIYCWWCKNSTLHI